MPPAPPLRDLGFTWRHCLCVHGVLPSVPPTNFPPTQATAQAILAPASGRPGDAHGTGRLDRCSRRRGCRFGPHASDFSDRSAPERSFWDPDASQHGLQAQPLLAIASSGFTPQQISTAYGIDQIGFGAIKGDGTGETIAIVDAYDDPNLVDSTSPNFKSSDLARFDLRFGLPDPPSFEKLGQDGTANLPAADPTGVWEVEEALDVEWAHAIAPAPASFSSSVILRPRDPPEWSENCRKSPGGLGRLHELWIVGIHLRAILR